MSKSSKVYAVRKGRNTGLFHSWDECEKQVKGYTGAEYKSFKTQKEAIEYLNSASKEFAGCITLDKIDSDTLIAYVDGSYNPDTHEYAYGLVILYKGDKITSSAKDNDVSLVDMRNVAGEIKGAEKAMQYATDHDIQSIVIFHDYEGIEKWCTGAWQAKKQGTKAYKEYYDRVSKKVKVRFVKVKAHSGDEYNEEADRLAKSALIHDTIN